MNKQFLILILSVSLLPFSIHSMEITKPQGNGTSENILEEPDTTKPAGQETKAKDAPTIPSIDAMRSLSLDEWVCYKLNNLQYNVDNDISLQALNKILNLKDALKNQATKDTQTHEDNLKSNEFIQQEVEQYHSKGRFLQNNGIMTCLAGLAIGGGYLLYSSYFKKDFDLKLNIPMFSIYEPKIIATSCSFLTLNLISTGYNKIIEGLRYKKITEADVRKTIKAKIDGNNKFLARLKETRRYGYGDCLWASMVAPVKFIANSLHNY